MQVREHYEGHLARFYPWMVGNLKARSNGFRDFLLENGIRPTNTKVALDLGAGHGIQSIAMNELGFEVTAIDFSDRLLNELKSNPRAKGIDTELADIRNVSQFRDLQPEMIVCYGDTITHLENRQEIEKLIGDANGILADNGSLILSFRDYSNELGDRQRFIPVKSSTDRILTCILEYGAEKVKVTDLLYERLNGEWNQKVSSYEKVRISPDEITDVIEKNGMEIRFDEPMDRMQTIIAQKRLKTTFK